MVKDSVLEVEDNNFGREVAVLFQTPSFKKSPHLPTCKFVALDSHQIPPLSKIVGCYLEGLVICNLSDGSRLSLLKSNHSFGGPKLGGLTSISQEAGGLKLEAFTKICFLIVTLV